MTDTKKIHSCLWAYRYEVLGLILLVIAVLLTVFTLDSIGIAAMFLVALVLCGHRCLCNKCCTVCHPDKDNDDLNLSDEPKSATKKSSTGKKE